MFNSHNTNGVGDCSRSMLDCPLVYKVAIGTLNFRNIFYIRVAVKMTSLKFYKKFTFFDGFQSTPTGALETIKNTVFALNYS